MLRCKKRNITSDEKCSCLTNICLLCMATVSIADYLELDKFEDWKHMILLKNKTGKTYAGDKGGHEAVL